LAPLTKFAHRLQKKDELTDRALAAGEFIPDNGGGPGVRLRKRQAKNPTSSGPAAL
jgi:hypothetical protein